MVMIGAGLVILIVFLGNTRRKEKIMFAVKHMQAKKDVPILEMVYVMVMLPKKCEKNFNVKSGMNLSKKNKLIEKSWHKKKKTSKTKAINESKTCKVKLN